MHKLTWGKRACAVFLLCAPAAIASSAQTFTLLHSFDLTDGGFPTDAPVQATNGDLYGTTVSGGASYDGTIFKIAPDGTLTTLYSFCSQSGCTDGVNPNAALLQAADGDFYGTTAGGGLGSTCQVGCGTVFKITPGGTLTTLHSFDGTDGSEPLAALVQGNDGNFYGTTPGGGANGAGTVFKITRSGRLTTLHSFCSLSGCPDGIGPAGLILAVNGDFYGTTGGGGANDPPYIGGTVFKITPSGTLTTLYSFCSQGGSSCTDGDGLAAGLVQGTDGNFYGTTYSGGANDNNRCYLSGGCGTIFAITSSGVLTTLYSFCSQTDCTDGDFPTAVLLQATDGSLYGTTKYGGAGTSCPYGCGTIFSISPSGAQRTVHSFNGAEGDEPIAGLVQDTDGTLYGTTNSGGAARDACETGCGTVFSLAAGLRPFVEAQPTSGKVGKAVKILGTNLTGATSVTFNGIPATFTVVGPSLITTTVPAGATTGRIDVTTPSGMLTSNVSFRVLP